MTERDWGHLAKWDRSRAEARLIDRMTGLQSMFSHLRSYSGPFDPQFPRTIFHLLFCPPLHCSIDPFETLGVIQRIFHSKDGKYLAVSFGAQPKFWRELATAEDKRAVRLLSEIRAIAQEHRIWVTYVADDGAMVHKYSAMPGVLQPPPGGEPRIVPFDEYLVRVATFDLTDPPTPGDLLMSAVDMNDITRSIANSELVESMPDQCRSCCVDLTERNKEARPPQHGYMRDTRQCPSCKTIYIREPSDDELTPEEMERKKLRRAVTDEFIRRIAEEFPRPKGSARAEDIVEGAEPEDPFDLFGGQTFGASDESWRGEDS